MLAPKMPSPVEVRASIPEFSSSSWYWGLAAFSGAFLLHAAVWSLALLASDWWLKVVGGLLSGVSTGILFVIGHDAAHGSLAPSPWANRWLARVAFLPSLHVLRTWQLGHNKLHHGWTNLRGKDPVYVPWSPADYESAPTLRRIVYRLYRHPLGCGFYYLVDVWLKGLTLRLPKAYREPLPGVWKDYAVVYVGFAFALAICYLTSASASEFVQQISLCIALPFVTWNYVMAFVTLQHHTHPGVAWYDRQEEWSFYTSQVQGTVHVILPPWLDWMFARIFHHTAHHVDKSIPLYRLVNAQQTLERLHSGVIRSHFSFREFWNYMKQCQLYDYRERRWVRF